MCHMRNYCFVCNRTVSMAVYLLGLEFSKSAYSFDSWGSSISSELVLINDVIHGIGMVPLFICVCQYIVKLLTEYGLTGRIKRCLCSKPLGM